MIIFDTNVLSEVMRSVPNHVKPNWSDRQPASSLRVNAIILYEVKLGIRQAEECAATHWRAGFRLSPRRTSEATRSRCRPTDRRSTYAT
ncbi:MAG: hypothetical protein AAGA20_04610 [Planctomycetota bacterium]